MLNFRLDGALREPAQNSAMRFQALDSVRNPPFSRWFASRTQEAGEKRGWQGSSGMVRIALMLIVACGSPAVGRADEASDIASAKSLSRAFRAVSKRIIPTVVGIKTAIRPRTFRLDPTPAGNQAPPDSPFENFFGDPRPGVPGARLARVARVARLQASRRPTRPHERESPPAS